MADECDVSRIVTTFFLNTCGLPPWPTVSDVYAAGCCGEIATKHPENDKETKLIPFITGSVAEFYIEPMLPHVGDVDVMFYGTTQLAIPQGYPPPTQLPAEFHNCVKVFEIIDSHLPGYVYLELCYLLTQHTDDGKYQYVKYHKGICLSNELCEDDGKIIVHGPALLSYDKKSPLLPVDSVFCVRCLSWPPQAADWPTRHRNYGWPDSATLDRVVSNGCFTQD